VEDNVPLECLYFQDSLIVLLVCGLELPPAVHVHWVLEFILQRLDFGFLVQQFLFFEADFCFQIIDASDLGVDGQILVPERGEFEFELS
jgi:hypothetical protein